MNPTDGGSDIKLLIPRFLHHIVVTRESVNYRVWFGIWVNKTETKYPYD